MVSLEHLEHFLKQAQKAGVAVWLAGLQPDLLESFSRLDFPALLPQDRVFPQGKDEDSATLAAIRAIRASLVGDKALEADKLYYLV
jgi:SulP family sulfate permease